MYNDFLSYSGLEEKYLDRLITCRSWSVTSTRNKIRKTTQNLGRFSFCASGGTRTRNLSRDRGVL